MRFCKVIFYKRYNSIFPIHNFNFKKEKNAVYIPFFLTGLETVCNDLRKHNFKEGIDFFCLRPVSFTFYRKNIQWEEIENFPESWERRTKEMIKMLPDHYDAIIDLGCGEGKLRNYIKEGCKYIGVDYRKRNKDTVIADFNKKDFPSFVCKKGEVYIFFCSGCMEYIEDVDWFMKKITDGKSIIISYCSLEHNRNMKNRRKLAWKNHLTVMDIINKMNRYKYRCTDSSFLKGGGNVIFKFESTERKNV